MSKLAILSNVNIDMVCKLLPNQEHVFKPQGYGNAFSLLLDNNSDLMKFSPEVLFFIVDISALTDNTLTYDGSINAVEEWFHHLQSCISPRMQYFISDVITRTINIEDTDETSEAGLEAYWLEKLGKLMEEFPNIHRFPLNKIISYNGKSTFCSDQLWYMGKIPFTSKGCKILAENIQLHMELLTRTPKKVLVLDLDNTLWGGVVGELGIEGIQLSDDKIGAIYRDSQILISQMQKRGVILAINSKNNHDDAMEVIQNHPHMILREKDFSTVRINWKTKVENLQSIAEELNLGLDSFVFIDDMPAEREAVRSLLPMVEVPEFPNSVDNLPEFYRNVYLTYFKKNRITKEDAEKTRLYRENAERNKLAHNLDFNSFLQSLKIHVERVTYDSKTKLRLAQLLQKTNQFNLTTKRYTEETLTEIEQNNWFIYLFRASDRFGDYGIIAAVLVDATTDIPRIDSFVMSCRVMGKLIENYILDYIEADLNSKGYQWLTAEYIPTAKNAPVKELYDNLGYRSLEVSSSGQRYQLDLTNRPKRSYFIEN
jgi:FkbH-like protein